MISVANCSNSAFCELNSVVAEAISNPNTRATIDAISPIAMMMTSRDCCQMVLGQKSAQRRTKCGPLQNARSMTPPNEKRIHGLPSASPAVVTVMLSRCTNSA